MQRVIELLENLKLLLLVWSDGGLKTKEILHYFLKFSELFDVLVEVNFFAHYRSEVVGR